MDTFAALVAALSQDPTLLIGLMAVSGLGLLGLGASTLLRGRKDVRRRAAEIEDAPGIARKPAGRGAASPSAERLMAYLETTFKPGNEREVRQLRRQMVQAGFFDARAIPVYFAARLGLLVFFLVTGLVALPFLMSGTATDHWLYAGALGCFGYFLPTLYLKRRIAGRTDKHRIGFPDFMDLMVVCSEAGLSMEASIDRIAREFVDTHPALAENLYMVTLEMRAGKAFPEALERLGERLGLSEAQMLATLLQQSAELGTSLSASLRVYSDEMRNKRLSRAEEKAYSLPAKLVVPLTLFVFPVLIATLMLPVVIRVGGAFQ